MTYANATGVTNALGKGEVAVVHFDAHADTGVSQNGTLYGHGTPMRRLVESGAVPGHRFVQVGLRGYWPEPEVMEWMDEQKMRCFLMNEIVDRGLEAVVDEAVDYSLAGGAKGVFISVDIDVVDPGLAPGTGTPEPGGLNSRELLDTVRRLGRELEVLGADIVEVSPPYDGAGEQTVYLANRVVLEVLYGMAARSVAGLSPFMVMVGGVVWCRCGRVGWSRCGRRWVGGSGSSVGRGAGGRVGRPAPGWG